MAFKVCLTAPGQPRKIVEISAEDTLEDLYSLASTSFGRPCTSLKTGFPPKPLERAASITTQSVVPNNERVTVVLEEEDKKPSSKKGGGKSAKKSQAKESTPAPSGRRPQRAAAKNATESFAEVIKAQDKILKEQNTKRKRSSTTTTRRSPEKVAAAAAAAASRKLARLPGRRLQDGAAVGPAATAASKSRKSSAKFHNKEDVSFALMNALESGGGGKVGKVLRGAMRNAITRQYDASRAVTRVSAVQAGKYTITPDESLSLLISFNKGMEGRGDFEETVDYIPREALEAVVKAIHGSDQESLRPATLSQLSPRVFWSLMKETNSPQSVEAALQQLLPDLDWSFLRRRKKALSEKAQENLRQDQVENGEEGNFERAAEAVQAVENAMQQLQQFDQTQRRSRAANAALARAQDDTWRLVTPSEQDEDELQECCGGSTQYVPKLLQLGIHNWRELANERSEDLADKLEGVDVATVEAWIDRAQQESVEEIVVEICDNRVDVVEVLREEARTGTAKDLANWRSMPEMLLQTASSLEGKVTGEDIATWCQRSYDLLQEYEWLSWYATPVE